MTTTPDPPPVARHPAVAGARRLARPLRQATRDVAQRREERKHPAIGWLREGQRQHPSPPDLWDTMWERRRQLVRSLAPGKSFLDLGGMFGIDGELGFIAEEAGATRVTLFDAMDPSDAFAEAHERTGSRLEFVQGDFHDPDVVDFLGQFDVVWCTGVIYHSPNPMQQILFMRQLTTERLVLGTHVIPEVPGIEQMCMLYPGVKEETQETFTRVFGGPERLPGMASAFDTEPLMAYVNMWWGFSPSAVRSMLHYSGFSIDEEHFWGPFWMDCVTTVGGQSTDIYPPLDQSDERVRLRHADTPDDQLPSWAARQVLDIRRRSS
jgi:hypothetical protein